MKKILVVDDDDIVRRVVRAGLESEGYEVDELSNGLNVLSYIRQHQYDLIILDILMDGKEGFEVATELDKEFSNIPVVMISSDVSYLQLAESFVDKVLPKPINIDALRSIVKDLTA